VIPPRIISTPGSPFDEVFRHVLCFGGEDVLLQPVVQGMVVGEPAKEAHGRMRMAIDQPREDQRAAGVNRSKGPMLRFDFGSLADCCNKPVAYGGCAVLDHTALCVHGDKRAPANKQIRAIHRPELLSPSDGRSYGHGQANACTWDRNGKKRGVSLKRQD
jgi:hypothetical protein